MTRARDLAAFVSNADGDIKFDTDTLFIDSSANRVGIGTTTPSEQINLVGSSGASKIRFDGDSSNLQNNFIGITGYDDLIIASDEANSGSASTIQFKVDSTERMRIDSSGRVGIGGVPNSNWRDNLANQQVLMLGTEATLFSDGNVTTELWNNAYVDDSNVFKNISTRGASRYLQYSGEHKWFIAASASAGSTITSEINTTPKMELDADGLKFNGDTAAANALDDYEEGTWTPAYDANTVTWSYSNQYGSYVKVGDLIHVQFYLQASTTGGTTSFTTKITGLPYTSANLSAFHQNGMAVWFTGSVDPRPLVDNNNTTISTWKKGVIATSTAAELSGSYLVGSGTYRTA